MCGIICSLLSENFANEKNEVITRIRNRGPDYFNEVTLSLTATRRGFFAASVLHTQGVSLAKQPLISDSGSVLLWNGDVFGGRLVNDNYDGSLSDSQILANFLENNDGNVLELIPRIEGPYSFIYFDAREKRIWFGRDPLGRHSLLWKTDGSFLVSSVGHKSVVNLKEVPAMGVFCLDIENPDLDFRLYPWDHRNDDCLSADDLLPSFICVSDVRINYFKNFTMCCDEINNHEIFFKNTGIVSGLDILRNLLSDQRVQNTVDELSRLLVESCRKRIFYRRNFCYRCSGLHSCSPDHVKLGILFSGGLDSTIIARIADKFVPAAEAIDLLNVSFDRNNSFNVPDRETGRMSLIELQTVCPNRTWNFVEINVTQEELIDARRNRISHLIYPLNTILDESLGCALWFACRGEGYLNNVSYISSAKVLLLGSGADEQFGGYVRHKNLLRRRGWNELQKQLLKETLSISKRNLGRDDRIASDSGRQPRFPFLDEAVVELAAGLPPWKKCDPVSFPPGIGDKLILRLVAVKLGLLQCATFPKRAFQFGCRIANAKEKGGDSSGRL